MTDAIEAGARACYDKFNENLIGCCEPAWDELPEDFRQRLTEAFEAGLQAALASGALVPASGDYVVVPRELAVSLARLADFENDPDGPHHTLSAISTIQGK